MIDLAFGYLVWGVKAIIVLAALVIPVFFVGMNLLVWFLTLDKD